MGADFEDEIAESRSVVQPRRFLSVNHPERCPSFFVERWTDELLCGGQKWVPQFVMPGFPTR